MKVYYSTKLLIQKLKIMQERGQYTIHLEIDDNGILKLIPNNHNLPIITQEPLKLVI